jgi:hypothetical protein
MPCDIRLLLSFKGHHKRKRLKRKIGDGYLDHLIDLWLSVATHRPDGILHGWTHEDIADYSEWDSDPEMLITALVESGWVDVYSREGGFITYKMHGWEKHQPWLMGAEARQEKARKAALVRHFGQDEAERIMLQASNGDAPSMPQACSKHAQGNAKTETSNAQSNAPSPSPSPSPPQQIGTPDKPEVPDTFDKVPLCPHQEIIGLYHKILPELTAVRIWSDSRQAFLRSRWREDPARQELKWWEDFFQKVKASDFLMGRVKEFKVDLEWLVRPTNFIKVIEGKFKNRNSGSITPLVVEKRKTHPDGHTCLECGFWDRCMTRVPKSQNFCSAAVNESRFFLKELDTSE